ncbi:YfhO family protein [Couchioplanes azureus]|uniref:YfhO family protein n=1 Tax=Couchioplanes caeruleus TaxID=56438 RepID=UPI00166FDAA3|nr:YfhO family protein [Couchioplanes caeruleus]GGQ69168.1 membrane protein [Couchioplanes caeruleus subsp. azureus]
MSSTGNTAGRRRRWRESEGCAATAGAVLAMASYCLALFARDTYPFGDQSRAVNDLANQFIPFHAMLWDLEHGEASGDLLFNWSSGYGVPFLGDFVTYLGNPFSWLVGLFPRDLVDLPVFLVTLFSIGLGTALMTVFLGRLRAGSPWGRALLGVGYGLSAWVVNDGTYDPMWMWGIVGLPLILLAMDRCLRGRNWALSSLLVALAWAGNFYTAAMATIAAVAVLLARLILAGGPLRDRFVTLLRAGVMTLVGVLLTAPVLTVSMLASKGSQPPPPATYRGTPDALAVLAQLLPGGRADSAMPNIFIGILGLLLVAAFPFHRKVAPKERLVWLSLLTLVTLSQLWRPGILLWHGFALPNGSPYRASFVITGLLVMIAWLSLARRPDPVALLAGGGLTAAILLLCQNQPAVRGGTWLTVLVGGPAMVGALLVLHWRREDRRRAAAWARAGAATVLAAGVFVGTAYSAYAPDAIRSTIAFFDPLPSMTEAATRAAFADVQRSRQWPQQRTETGPHRFANNDPALLRGEGARYYSSYLPAKTAEALQGIGISWTMRGRHIHSPEDPVTRALMGVIAYLEPRPGGYALTPAGPAAPLVTVHPGDAAGRAVTDSVYARQQALLGATVYDVPELRHTAGPAPVRTADGWRIPAARKGDPRTVFSARCTPGSDAYFYDSWFAGRVRGPQFDLRFPGSEAMNSNPLRFLGTVPATGEVRLEVSAARTQNVSGDVLGCLDRGKLANAVARLRATGATRVETGGHTISAVLPASSAGMAVIKVTAVDGWTCSTDRRGAVAPTSFHGFLGVPLEGGASRVDCSYQPPGLRAGLFVSALALAALLAGLLWNRLAVRLDRRRSPAAGPELPQPRWPVHDAADDERGVPAGR